ncbi:hypothetical protein KFK09_025784 [Dendrobium nobile]|uniref:Exocyst subunit Exo70 family protein n=1 Tax=Dendrobium nobile TaxID=94219 RepID=A0A8T3A6D0_DENNO|nr:hypothetical protein KFK09_025784 [Dendrobium nobile]
MGVPPAIEVLKERATLLRESLQKSQTITGNMVDILGSFDHRLSALETAMRPTQVRTHAIRRAHENIDKTLKSADVILVQFDITRQAEAKILRGPHEDLESYLEAIDQLRRNVQFFTSNKTFKWSDGVLNHANILLSKAIMKLEEEFKQLLSTFSKPVEPDRLFECLPSSLRPSAGSPGQQGEGERKPSSASNSDQQGKSLETAIYKPPTLIPPRLLPLLHDLALQTIQAGKQDQCVKIYCETRSSALEQSLRKLGVEKLSKEDVQKMPWEVLEAKIGNWIHYMRIAVKLLFAAERKICDQIFDGINVLKDRCFAEVTADSVLMLFSFGDAIAKSKRSPEKLFVLLDMYEIMRELHSEIETIFEGKACSETRDAAHNLSRRLAQTAQETFGDFEEAVEKDATKTAVLDGTVHPLTSYVINYVKFLFESEAKDLLGDDWVQRHRRIVQQNANQYKRVAWAKILQSLSVQGQSSSGGSIPGGSDGGNSSGVSRATIKERLKSFNMQFEELHQRQSQWTVPDPELRESLRLAVAEVLLPAYRSFIKRFGPLIDSGKNPQKYVRYTPEDLERMLGEFFEGKTWNEQKR